MRICVVGAGAIGGLIAAHLAEAEQQVTVIDVGEHLRAIQSHGLKIVGPTGSTVETHQLRAVERMEDAGQQDLVILAVKTNVLPEIAPRLAALYGTDTCVLPMQNGVPWWYFQRHGGAYEGRIIASVDPGGRIAAGIDPNRILGCVVFPAGEIIAPGIVKHVEGNRFPVGELDGTQSQRAAGVAAALTGAGFKSFVIDDIRAEIWLKLWGNLSFNPISALTHATMEDICRFPATRQLVTDMMLEAQNVATELGIHFRVSLEKRIAGAEKVGGHKTSMLQDVEAGRPLEIEAIIGAVIELGSLVGVPTPSIDAVYAAVKLLDKRINASHSALQFLDVA